MTVPAPNLKDRQEISEALYRYCRALDRMDLDLMSSVFHPGATVEYPRFRGRWQGFTEYIWDRHREFDAHSHQVSNVIVEVDTDGQRAHSESYVTATLWRTDPSLPGEVRQTGTWARYVDSWTQADGRWAIEHRVCVVDFMTEQVASGAIGTGRRDTNDASYGLARIAELSRG